MKLKAPISMSDGTVAIRPRAALMALVAVAVGVVALSVVLHLIDEFWSLGAWLDYFDVDHDANFPNWVATLYLAFAAVLLSVSALSATERIDRTGWYGLALVFLVLSLDEASRIHEQLGNAIAGFDGAKRAFTSGWVIPYLVAAGVVMLLLARFLRRLPPDTLRLFVVSGVIYVGGSVGFNGLTGVLLSSDASTRLVAAAGHIEELMELTGVALFIYAVLVNLGRAGFRAIQMEEAEAGKPG